MYRWLTSRSPGCEAFDAFFLTLREQQAPDESQFRRYLSDFMAEKGCKVSTQAVTSGHLV